MKLEQEIRQHIVNEYLKGKEPDGFDNDYNLIDGGILDSLTIINLVNYLERTYTIQFGENEIVPEHLSSVMTLGNFVGRKLGK